MKTETNKKRTEISHQELVKSEKQLKAITFIFAAVLIVLCGSTVFLTLKNGFTAAVITPVALIPLLIICLYNWQEVKKELKSRNLN